LFTENIGVQLSIDETSLSNGELYTIITNKAAKGRHGSIVAMIKGTQSEDIINIVTRTPLKKRQIVSEITLDMANSMNLIAKKCFPNAIKVIDRFHVQKLAYEALQEIRISHRWEAINMETNDIENAKLDKKEYIPDTFRNGDTLKQLLFRSRYLLFKSPEKWSVSQKERAKILFERYPEINEAYWLVHKLRVIYNSTKDMRVEYTKLARWFNDVTNFKNIAFNTITATIYTHCPEILNFFDNRSTNASAESFNSKLKSFRASIHGVSDVNFFFFRVSKIYA
jgi:transposase